MQHLSLPYVAGFFDGEGSISIIRNDSVLQCSLGQIYPVPLRRIQKRWGGSLTWAKSKKVKRGVWKLQLSARKAEHFLIDILPFLVVKFQEAKAALAFRTCIRRKGNQLRLTEPQRRLRRASAARFHKIRKRKRSQDYPTHSNLTSV